MGKVAGAGAGGTVMTARAASASANSMGILANLATMAATLGLNIATVNVLGGRIDAEALASQQALDQVNAGALRLYQKNKGDISAVQAYVDDQSAAIDAQNATISNLRSELSFQKTDLRDLSSRLDTTYEEINDLNQEQSSLREEILSQGQALEQLQGASIDLQNTVGSLGTALYRAYESIGQQKEVITKVTSQIADIERKVNNLDIRVTQVESDIREIKTNFEILRQDLDENEESDEVRSVETEHRLIALENKTSRRRTGGLLSSLNGEAALAKTGILLLTNRMSLNPKPREEILADHIVNSPSGFRTKLDELLDLANPPGMTPEQIENFKTDIDKNTKSALGLAIGTLLIPDLVTLKDRTAPGAISQATQDGICKSLNGGGCPSTPGNSNPVQGLKGMNDNLIDKVAQGADLAQGAAILKYVKNTNEGVRHAEYGLEAMQKFASIAWKNTRINKVLDILSIALSLHNAAMLSRNLAGSLGDIISAIANNTISLITNEEGDSIDINNTLGKSVESLLKSVLGASNYDNLSETFSKYNRIVNAAANITYSIMSVQAGLAEGLNIMGSYTGKIGNALKKSGAVLENSYTWMSEKMSVQTGRLGQIQRIIDRAESAENIASEIENATSEFREVQTSVSEIKGQYTKIKTDLTKQETDKTTLENKSRANSQAAQPDLSDFSPDPIQD